MVELEKKLKDKTAVIGIIGLGYVGLPLAIAFAETGFRVIGLDMQASRVASVSQGKSYLGEASDEEVSKVVKNGLLEATAEMSRLKEANAISICVPTPLTKTKEPDLSYVIQVSEVLYPNIRRGQLIVLESTTYPGTTREIVLPILERSNLKAGEDFYLAYSPERIDPGNKKYRVNSTPRIVGGIDARSTQLAELLYRQVASQVIVVSSPEVAEMTKIFENVFRSVNIALVNELAQICEAMGISVWEVIDTAATKPFGYMPFYPGPGVGGHCIPVNPYYLVSKAREYGLHTRFIELAAEINERMPYYVASRVMEALNNRGRCLRGAKVIVLGVAYKKDIEDSRGSSALELIQLLLEKGAQLMYNDAHISQIKVGSKTLTSVELTRERVSAADCVVIATDHSYYNYEFIVDNATLVFDTRGVTRKLGRRSNVVRLGESEHTR